MRKSRHWLPILLLTCPTALLADASGPKHVPGCHAEPPPSDTPVAPALLEGYGTGGFPIKTTNPEAQKYFDNGMQLAHAFAHNASAAAFRRAEQLDPACAMCVWGEAWTRGPSINFSIDTHAQGELLKLAGKAARLASPSTPLETQLIAALQKRYQKGGGTGEGDLAYARAMDEIASTNPTNNEIATLAADAWMIPPAWWYPLRRSVAAALLAQGNARAAKIEAQQALNSWPNDPLSLKVLADCDRAMGETAEEQAVLTNAERNWTGSLASVPLSQI